MLVGVRQWLCHHHKVPMGWKTIILQTRQGGFKSVVVVVGVSISILVCNKSLMTVYVVYTKMIIFSFSATGSGTSRVTNLGC